MAVPTPHNEAKKGDFAKTVLMPGDPKRSEFIAKTFFDSPRLVNDVRGVKGYTGFYKGKEVSVMASGMGQPAIGIYSYELYSEYGVESIIRVGSCGAYSPKLHLSDLVIAVGASTDSNFQKQYNLPGYFSPTADFGLAMKAAKVCEERGIKYEAGNILSADVFYSDTDVSADWSKMGVLAVEMESAALYCTAARLDKKALCILTVSDSFVYTDKQLTSFERERSMTNMIEVALEIA